MKNVNEFQTKDFYVCAFLVTKGHKVTAIDRADPHRVFFSFKNFEGREGDKVEIYEMKNGHEEARKVIENVKKAINDGMELEDIKHKLNDLNF